MIKMRISNINSKVLQALYKTVKLQSGIVKIIIMLQTITKIKQLILR
jgi:hypothetical protein